MKNLHSQKCDICRFLKTCMCILSTSWITICWKINTKKMQNYYVYAYTVQCTFTLIFIGVLIFPPQEYIWHDYSDNLYVHKAVPSGPVWLNNNMKQIFSSFRTFAGGAWPRQMFPVWPRELIWLNGVISGGGEGGSAELGLAEGTHPATHVPIRPFPPQQGAQCVVTWPPQVFTLASRAFWLTFTEGSCTGCGWKGVTSAWI